MRLIAKSVSAYLILCSLYSQGTSFVDSNLSSHHERDLAKEKSFKVAADNAKAAMALAKPGTALWHYHKGIEEITGINRVRNATLANEHFKRSAEMGYVPAIKALADSYYSGDGIDKNIDKALFLYLTAADLGDGAAQFNLGIILLRGYANGHVNYPLAFYYLALTTINKDLDEMAQEAAIYRDEAALMLTPEEAQEIFIKIGNNMLLNNDLKVDNITKNG